MTSAGKAIPNPNGRDMRRMEREGAASIAGALTRLRRSLVAGLDDARDLERRVNDADLWQPFTDALTALVTEWAEAGALFGRQQVEAGVLGTAKLFNWDMANESALRWALTYVARLVGGIQDTTRRRIQQEVARHVADGETLEALVRRVASLHTFSEDRARMIAVTEVTRAFAEGNMAAWRESGVIQRRRWNTNNDELVCPICGPLHNMVVDMGAPFPGNVDNPPAHPRCRCWVSPVVVERERPVGLQQ